MKQLTERQRDFLALGKRMKEVIQLSKDLASDGHPVVNKWVDDVEEIVQKYSESHMLDNIWRYQDFPL